MRAAGHPGKMLLLVLLSVKPGGICVQI
uniref:Uncharacterized protein n=1 Tax=Arundo donax TaxID=35708 RepID=A0A0A9GWH8_ARUDO